MEAAPLLSPPRPQGQSAAQRRRGGSVPGGRPVCAARAACGRDEDCPPRPERRGRRGRAGSSIVSASAAKGAGPSEREVSVAARRLGSGAGTGACAAGHLAARDPPRPGRPRRRAPAGPDDPPRAPDPARGPGTRRAANARARRGLGGGRGASRPASALPSAACRARASSAEHFAKCSPSTRSCVPARAAEPGLRKAGPPGSRAGAGARAAAGRLIHCGPEQLGPPAPRPVGRLLRAAPGRAAPGTCPGESWQGGSGGSARARVGLWGGRGFRAAARLRGGHAAPTPGPRPWPAGRA